MKKVLSFVAIAAMATVFVTSCGNDEAEKKRKEDSAKAADSMAKMEADMKHKQDSAHIADSTKMAMDQAEMMRKQDSTRMADSVAAAKKGGHAAPKAPVKPGTPKVGGKRPGAK